MGGSSSKTAKAKRKQAGKKTCNAANGKVHNDKDRVVEVDTDNNANGEVIRDAKAETRTEQIQDTQLKDKKRKVKSPSYKIKKDKGRKVKGKKGKEKKGKNKKGKDKKGKEQDDKDKNESDNNKRSVDKNTSEQNNSKPNASVQKNSGNESDKRKIQHFEKNSKGKTPPKVAQKDPTKRLSNCNDNSNNPSPLPKQREQERERTSQQSSPDVSTKERCNAPGEVEGHKALENVLTEQIRTLQQEKQSLTQDLPLLDLHQAGSDEDNYSTDDGLCYDEDGGLLFERATGFEESPEVSKLRHLNKNRAPVQQKRKPARFSRLIPEEEIIAAGKQEKLKRDKKGSGKDKNKKDKKLKKKDSRGLSDSSSVAVV